MVIIEKYIIQSFLYVKKIFLNTFTQNWKYEIMEYNIFIRFKINSNGK